MRKRVLFIFGFCFIFALCVDSASITDLVPANNTYVSDCPSFSWKTYRIFADFDVYIRKQGDSWPTSPLHSDRLKLDPTPWDMNTLLDIGTYEWKVVHNDVESGVNTFIVNEHSCIPPFVENSIDNTMQTGVSDVITLDNQGKKIQKTIFRFETSDSYAISTNQSQHLFWVYGPDDVEDSKLIVVKARETYPDEATEAASSTVTLEAKAGSHFNVFGFRYIFFTDGDSTMTIELVDNSDRVVQFIDCIGGTDPSCRDYFKHMSPRISEGKWVYVSYFIPPL